MSPPEIRFSDIRPHDDSRSAGFEELCCQLAALERRAANAEFVRKGQGGDGGVECLVKYPDGREVGWQAKYIFKWTKGLKRQLDLSVETALEKHPSLSGYVVCLPFNLPDAPAANVVTARGHWNNWVSEWSAKAASEGRTLAIELWDASALVERLSRGGAAYAGRLHYWFGIEELTPAWMRHRFELSCASLGARYTPASNVELPIRQQFLAFVRDPSLSAEIEQWQLQLQALMSAVSCAARDVNGDEAADQVLSLQRAVRVLIAHFSGGSAGLHQPFAVAEWESIASGVYAKVQDVFGWAFSLQDSEARFDSDSPAKQLLHQLSGLASLLARIAKSLDGSSWALANANRLLLTGEAGVGKSHLLADVVAHQIERGAPAILLLGSMFKDDEPWRQIMNQLDLPDTMRVQHFLAALDAAAEAAGMRALICIDAINEHSGLTVWPDRLAAFLQTAAPHRRVAVCVSCRTTYVDNIVPHQLDESALPRLEHIGFAGTAGDAAQRYLDQRGIVRPGAPNMLPEFHNPLLLKFCCDHVDKQERRELPKGLQGVTAVFQFYTKAMVAALNLRMKNAHLWPDLVGAAIRLLTDEFSRRESGFLPLETARALLNTVSEPAGLAAGGLLELLEKEGVLTVEPMRGEDGRVQNWVRFTFERFSDHQIAKRLLVPYADATQLESGFLPSGPLHTYVTGPRCREHAGVIEALAIQLPERFGLELPDLIPAEPVSRSVSHAFEQSLLWREQSVFTKRTLELARQLLGKHRTDQLLFEIAAEPANRFNARHLHRRLITMAMPQRDATWSLFVARQVDDDAGPIATLISWAHAQGMRKIDGEHAELAGIVLTWLLSTSARLIRDRATTALVCLLAPRPRLAILLLQHFARVDDLYVRERLFAAMYGAVLQDVATDGVADLAAAVYQNVFEHGRPPVNTLLRQHARSLVRIVQARGHLPRDFKTNMTEPPYISAWPIEYVSDEVVSGYSQTYFGGSAPDEIARSTELDSYFSQLEVEPAVEYYSPVPRGQAPLRSEELFGNWLNNFLSDASPDQRKAWKYYQEAAMDANDERSGEEAATREQFDAAEQVFRASLSTDAWEEFRAIGRDYLIRLYFGRNGRGAANATFNVGWACRWICKRAHEMGWTARRFASFERRSVSDDQRDHRVESIGKKYQWLALYELVARMDDHLAYARDENAEDGLDLHTHIEAMRLGLRNIDPSLLVRASHYELSHQWRKTWWLPAEPNWPAASLKAGFSWKDDRADIANHIGLLDVQDPKDGRRWLVLRNHANWKKDLVIDGEGEMNCSNVVYVNCMVVKKSDVQQVIKFFQQQESWDPAVLPKLDVGINVYLGEYPWHPVSRILQSPRLVRSKSPMPVPFELTVAHYSRERLPYDYSLDKTVSVLLPSAWLSDAMSLRLVHGRELKYVDRSNHIQFFDTSVSAPGFQAALVDRDAFLAMLASHDLEAVWVIHGSKSVSASHGRRRGSAGRLSHRGVYRLVNGSLTGDRPLFRWTDPLEGNISAYWNAKA